MLARSRTQPKKSSWSATHFVDSIDIPWYCRLNHALERTQQTALAWGGDSWDLADAKKVANEQLAGIDQRREAAVEVPPVLNVIDTYETVLRDIRNVDERSSADDIIDIKNRIQSNALIANMKAFQPRVSTVGLSLR